MILSDAKTWPNELIAFLDSRFETIRDFTQHQAETMERHLNPVGEYISMALMPANQPCLALLNMSASSITIKL